MNSKYSSKKLALLAMSIALAMILSFVESQIPSFVAVPGVKVGLANIVVIFALYRLGAKEAIIISIIRVLLVSLLFGNMMSLWYSLAGAVLSFIGMIIMKKCKVFSYIAVSVAGGVLHNMGQIGMACLVLETDIIKYYAPFLVLSGVIAGVVTGLAASIMIKRIDVKV